MNKKNCMYCGEEIYSNLERCNFCGKKQKVKEEIKKRKLEEMSLKHFFVFILLTFSILFLIQLSILSKLSWIISGVFSLFILIIILVILVKYYYV